MTREYDDMKTKINPLSAEEIRLAQFCIVSRQMQVEERLKNRRLSPERQAEYQRENDKLGNLHGKLCDMLFGKC